MKNKILNYKKNNLQNNLNKKNYLFGLSLIILWTICLGFSGFHLYTAFFGLRSPMIQRSLHLFFSLLICFLIFKFNPKTKRDSITFIEWIIFIFISAIGVYFLTRQTSALILNRGMEGANSIEILVGFFIIICILEATRRAIGLPLVLVAISFLLYAYFGSYMPSFISHKGYSIGRLVDFLVWSTEGIFGIPIKVSSSFVVMFIIFGAFLGKFGVGNFFIKLALGISGKKKGGPAQAAVISSAMMGSISGSAVSNVVTTGTFTIPLMIRVGYTPFYAAAVEAVASTGGQIMPPVMGATAFVLAEMIGIPYIQVALAAFIPAFLYFLAIWVMVYIEADKMGISIIPKNEIPNAYKVFTQEFYLLIPLVILVYYLAFVRLSPMRSCIFAIISLLIIGIIQAVIKEKRFPFKEIMGGLKEAAEIAIPVALACASAGIIIGIISLTGLGVRFTSLIVKFSGGNLAVTLFLTMIACLILGMGIPTTAAYIMTSILAAPALIDLGLPVLVAHLFIFYFAVISFITPPVAISAYAASGIADANPMTTGYQAFKLGLAGFIVPYMFVYGPSLILQGDFFHILISVITAIIGIIALALSLEGWLYTKLSYWKRIILFISALSLIAPKIIFSLVGIFPFIAIFIYQYFQKKNSAPKISSKKLLQENSR